MKGQRARKGGYHKVGFEGGQMPLQRRMPKVGFRSKIKATRAEVRLSELNGIEAAVIDLDVLKKANVVDVFAEQAKVVLSGELKKAVTLKGIGATKGAPRPLTRPAAASRPDRALQEHSRAVANNPVNESGSRTRRRERASARFAAACCS